MNTAKRVRQEQRFLSLKHQVERVGINHLKPAVLAELKNLSSILGESIDSLPEEVVVKPTHRVVVNMEEFHRKLATLQAAAQAAE